MSHVKKREAQKGHDEAVEKQNSKNGQDWLMKLFFDYDFEQLRW